MNLNPHIFNIFLNLLLIAGGALTLYGVYFCFIALFGFKKQAAPPHAAPRTRFAVVIAARNEAAVIGNLVDSLKAQNYPRELYRVVVAPNNCTDDTEAVARAHGAEIFRHRGRVRSKGEVLRQVAKALLKDGGADAMCVFDADNLVDPGFLQAMNDAAQSGIEAAQGFRDSKNPTDSAVSTCYSVCYWMVNRFYNGGRQALGLSALINGSGFMVSCALLRRLGGWNTSTMTEDYEFTAQCVLAGERVHYMPGAVIYDEQPLTFFQSWKQRRRWSTGSVQGMELYLQDLVKTAVKRRSWAAMDLAFTFMTPAIQAISLVIGAASAVMMGFKIQLLHLLPLAQVLWLAAAAAAGAFALCAVLAAFVVWLNRGRVQGTEMGIVMFALFLLSWVPIGIISLFVRKTTWDAIAHTKAVGLAELDRG